MTARAARCPDCNGDIDKGRDGFMNHEPSCPLIQQLAADAARDRAHLDKTGKEYTNRLLTRAEKIEFRLIWPDRDPDEWMAVVSFPSPNYRMRGYARRDEVTG